ncbi:hypothetical protein ABEB36_006140 [Hypothenemus hampei]|uniref:Uncharacterized protein n=1 Tax=Hypothenemus hampei TaxID=57062 RepID=A0ABD1F0P3_HYPHA
MTIGKFSDNQHRVDTVPVQLFKNPKSSTTKAMGNTQAKQEEIIISQAGNSGGKTGPTPHATVGLCLGAMAVAGLIALTAYSFVKCCWRKTQKNIRKEIYKSREMLQV